MIESKKPCRKYWLGCNWKSNGSVSLIKDSVKNMINDLAYDSNRLGKQFNDSIVTDFMIMPGILHLPII